MLQVCSGLSCQCTHKLSTGRKTQGYKIREEKKTDAAPKSVALCNFQFSSNVSFVSLNTEIWR